MSLDPVSSGDPHVPAHNAEREAINDLETALATKIPLPSGAATGDLLRWTGTAWETTETRFFEGEGTPNGVIAAPIGSRYVDKLATDEVVEWTKTAGGTGNTGWTSKRQREVTGDSKSCTQGPANAMTGPVRVDFPVGRFSAQPAVTAIASDATINGVWVTSITSTGFDLYFRGTVAGRAFTANWIAVVKG